MKLLLFASIGKTLLAKAVANQTSATFLRVCGSELIQKYLVSISTVLCMMMSCIPSSTISYKSTYIIFV